MNNIYTYIIASSILIASCTSIKIISSKFKASNDYTYFLSCESQKYYPMDAISMKFFDNEEYLDIILETNRVSTLEKILNYGLSISIDSQAKGKRQMSINYPLPIDKKLSKDEYNTDNIMLTQSMYQDVFINYEIVKNKIFNTYECSNTSQGVELKVVRNKNILFSYMLRIKKDLFFENKISSNISIGISSIYEYEQRYLSSMTSREVIEQGLNEYKVGTIGNNNPEINEEWVNIKLAYPSK